MFTFLVDRPCGPFFHLLLSLIADQTRIARCMVFTTSVNYHRNVQGSILWSRNPWLTLTMLGATGPRSSTTIWWLFSKSVLVNTFKFSFRQYLCRFFQLSFRQLVIVISSCMLNGKVRRLRFTVVNRKWDYIIFFALRMSHGRHALSRRAPFLDPNAYVAFFSPWQSCAN